MAKKGFKPVFTFEQLKAKGITVLNDNGIVNNLPAKPKAGKIAHKKTTFNGIEYKSKLEAKFAQELTFRGIPFEYEVKSFEVVEGFKFQGKKVQPITYKPDFFGEGWIVETKGYANEAFPLRLKLFKKYLVDNDIKVDFWMIKDEKQIQEFIKVKFGK